MAPHSSVLAWRIPETGEPGGLPSMGSHRLGHDWSDLAAAAAGTSPVSGATKRLPRELHSASSPLQLWKLSVSICVLSWFILIFLTGLLWELINVSIFIFSHFHVFRVLLLFFEYMLQLVLGIHVPHHTCQFSYSSKISNLSYASK